MSDSKGFNDLHEVIEGIKGMIVVLDDEDFEITDQMARDAGEIAGVIYDLYGVLPSELSYGDGIVVKYPGISFDVEQDEVWLEIEDDGDGEDNIRLMEEGELADLGHHFIAGPDPF